MSDDDDTVSERPIQVAGTPSGPAPSREGVAAQLLTLALLLGEDSRYVVSLARDVSAGDRPWNGEQRQNLARQVKAIIGRLSRTLEVLP